MARNSILIIGIIILGIIESFISDVFPVLSGMLLLICGAFQIFQAYGDKKADYLKESLDDTLAELLLKRGMGNLYKESILREIRKKGRCDDVEARLQKALELDPNDFEALWMQCSINHCCPN